MNLGTDALLFAKAVADDTRYEIMCRLCCVWLSVNDLVEQLGGKIKQPTVSHHLKFLEDVQLVHVRQEGRQRFYTLNQERIDFCCGQLRVVFQLDSPSQIVQVETIPVIGE